MYALLGSPKMSVRHTWRGSLAVKKFMRVMFNFSRKFNIVKVLYKILYKMQSNRIK